MSDLQNVVDRSKDLAEQAATLTNELQLYSLQTATPATESEPFVFLFTVFVLACFVGYYVVWKVTPALHTPLMAVTNAISGIIIVGAIIALGSDGNHISHLTGFVAVTIASINIFGGFIVTQRMLSMFQKKQAKRESKT